MIQDPSSPHPAPDSWILHPVPCILNREFILKVVFVKQDCLLQPALAAPRRSPPALLRPGVADGLAALADHKLFIIVLDMGSCAVSPEAVTADKVATRPCWRAIRAGGGRVDALMQCPHDPASGCGCWSTYPGFLYAAAARLDLRLDECYLLCDQASDVLLAYRAECRPMLILDGRGIGDLYDGHQPEPSDFPIARDFPLAVQYVLAEEEANEEWGHAAPAGAPPAGLAGRSALLPERPQSQGPRLLLPGAAWPGVAICCPCRAALTRALPTLQSHPALRARR